MKEAAIIARLMATAGAATLSIAMIQAGILEKPADGNYDGLPVPSIRSDPKHVAVVQLSGLSERLIYDDDFGWLWYDSDGPADGSAS